MANYLINDIGFQAGNLQRKKINKTIQSRLGIIVDKELNQMARGISNTIVGLAGSNKQPSGSIRITGKIARAMKGRSGPMTISSVTGIWRERSKTYLRWKSKKYRTRRWFKNSGELQSQLSKASTYKNAYGPMSAKFVPARIPQASLSSLGRSVGRPSREIVTGRIEVSVFSRLGISDLPGVGRKATYSKKRLSGFADNIERKLTGPNPKIAYRPVLEPYLTYYMNRKIPNAVFRSLEDSILS